MPTSAETCTACKGNTTIIDPISGEEEPYTCPDCGGTGRKENQISLGLHIIPPGEVVYEHVQVTYAEVAATLNHHADVWEADGTDPCRVRLAREWANAYRTYAEGVGVPSIQTLREKRDAALAEVERLKEQIANPPWWVEFVELGAQAGLMSQARRGGRTTTSAGVTFMHAAEKAARSGAPVTVVDKDGQVFTITLGEAVPRERGPHAAFVIYDEATDVPRETKEENTDGKQ